VTDEGDAASVDFVAAVAKSVPDVDNVSDPPIWPSITDAVIEYVFAPGASVEGKHSEPCRSP